MEITIEDLLKLMLNFFQNIDKQIQQISEEQRQKDLEREDILHYFENHNMNAADYCKYGKLLRQVQIERRKIKFDLERTQCIRDTLTQKYNNKLITGDIIKTIKELKEIDKKQSNPKYKCRTNILEELITQDEKIQEQESDS